MQLGFQHTEKSEAHDRDLQFLMRGICKTKHDRDPRFMKQIFEKRSALQHKML